MQRLQASHPVSWSDASDETVDCFTAHYRINLNSMRHYVISAYSNRKAVLLIARLIEDKDGENFCHDSARILPQI
jgi:hypothetical protein